MLRHVIRHSGFAMSYPIRQLPVIQNWSYHQCGNCCREYFVTVTDEEVRRIEQQGWSERPEFKERTS